MKKIICIALLLALICTSLTGCIHWETPVSYELLLEVSEIKSIRVYNDAADYNHSDPIEPCGELLGEIPAEHYSAFIGELTGLPFIKTHLIILFPVSYDPNFYYGEYIIKVEYLDGSCELISDIMQRQFVVNEKYPNDTKFSVDTDLWMTFLQNWVNIPS